MESVNTAMALRRPAHASEPAVPRPWNPLADDPLSRRFSSYAMWQDPAVALPLAPGQEACGELRAAHDILRSHVLGEKFPCVGARSALNRGGYRFGLYPALATPGAVHAVCHDLYEFCREFPVVEGEFLSFIAMFRAPQIESEHQFETLLWDQLQAMHDLDSDWFAWDSAVGAEPDQHNFSYSVGGCGMFVVGLHPKASRRARTFAYPTLVFNPHQQFERLRERGKFEQMKTMIRARDLSFQGSINPMLANFGDISEARQYSGRAVGADWQCPFHPHRNKDQA